MLIWSFSMWLWGGTIVLILFLVFPHIVQRTTIWGFYSFLLLHTHGYGIFYIPPLWLQVVVDNEGLKLFWQWSHDQMENKCRLKFQVSIHWLQLCSHIAHPKDVLSYSMFTPGVLFRHQLLDQLGGIDLWRTSELTLYLFKELLCGSTLCNWTHIVWINCILYKCHAFFIGGEPLCVLEGIWHLDRSIVPLLFSSCCISVLSISEWLCRFDRLWGVHNPVHLSTDKCKVHLLSPLGVVITSEGWYLFDATHQVVPSWKSQLSENITTIACNNPILV